MVPEAWLDIKFGRTGGLGVLVMLMLVYFVRTVYTTFSSSVGLIDVQI